MSPRIGPQIYECLEKNNNSGARVWIADKGSEVWRACRLARDYETGAKRVQLYHDKSSTITFIKYFKNFNYKINFSKKLIFKNFIFQKIIVQKLIFEKIILKI